jgi:hypothetical protein
LFCFVFFYLFCNEPHPLCEICFQK